MKDVVSETSQYRVLIEIPRVARQGTTWRTIAIRGSYSEVGDLADYLVSSMGLAGIDREAARGWVMAHVKCQPETVTTVKDKPEPMPIGP